MWWALGILAVATPLSLQLHWRQQAAFWRRGQQAMRRLPAPQPPGELAVRPEREPEIVVRRRLAREPARESSGPSGLPLTGLGLPQMMPRPAETRLSVAVVPGDVTTYVYLNGGSLLGRAPLRDIPVRPGTHRLVLWAPSIRGRATEIVSVRPGEHASVITVLSAATTSAAGLAH